MKKATPESSDPIANSYFTEVGKYPLPTAKEERELFTAYKKAQTQAELGKTAVERNSGKQVCKELGSKLACYYLRFVILQARRKTNDSQLLLDLIGQGNIGLMVGIERFDVSRGVRFLTYAASWINVYMQEHLHKLGVVHVPSHTRKEMSRQRTKENIQLANGEIRASKIEEPTTTSLDGVSVANDVDVETDASRSIHNLFSIMQKADLLQKEKLTITYLYGLRGTEFSADELVQFFYELDGSIFQVQDIAQFHNSGLSKIKELLRFQGITQLRDLF